MKLVYLTLLFDIYGELLTVKQQDFFEDYYHDNLSLREIADKYNISHQGVRDNLKRTESILTSYEEKLGILEKEKALTGELKNVISLLDTIEIEEKDREMIKNKIISLIDE